MKRWTYRQITQETTQELERLNALATDNMKRFPGADVKYLHDWAYGAYDLWRGLTLGWQEEGDDARMKALADSVGRTQEPAKVAV